MGRNQATFNLGIKTDADLSGINKLKTSLEQVRKEISNIKLNLDPVDVQAAYSSISSIERALSKSFDVKLNTVNVSKFNQEMIKTHGSIQQVYNNLHAIGPAGDKAFFSMASSVMQANKPLRETDELLQKLSKSFLNSVRYQLMNTTIQKISGSISEAYGYVKRLDSSLNDIQIVTEKNTKSMRQFAEEANKAAQSLGAGTVDYTDASLIYYQQGLNDREVAERTNTTMKMANVLGETASQVSDYMTAIWNNFDDGSKSLEYFGDVITSLGANTAASAAEIAAGLGKFAAVAETTGLSYEYATSALATVVAETRQSADTVGTAFKTLFSRIQDLELGEEGSVSIGKYSQALEKVGIQVLDTTGNLKPMNDLLDEMGSKWDTLTKAQQTALAQNVGGARQYTQLMALMENWDKVKQNIDLTGESIGTLERKNAIYMDSISAHAQQMETQWEAFFDSMIDENSLKGLIDLGTAFAKLLTGFSDTIGGIGPLLGYLGSISTNVFKNQIASSVAAVITNFKNLNQDIDSSITSLQTLQSMFGENSWVQTQAGVMPTGQTELLAIMEELCEKAYTYKSVMSEADMQGYNKVVQMGEIAGAAIGKLAEFAVQMDETGSVIFSAFNLDNLSLDNIDQVSNAFLDIANQVRNFSSSTIESTFSSIGNIMQQTGLSTNAIASALNNATDGTVVFDEKLQLIKGTTADLQRNFDSLKDVIQTDLNVSTEKINDITKAMSKAASTAADMRASSSNLFDSKQLALHIQQVMNLASGVGMIASGVSTLRNQFKNLFDTSIPLADRLLGLLTSMSIVIPSFMSGFKMLSSVGGNKNNSFTANNSEQSGDKQRLLLEEKITAENKKQEAIKHRQHNNELKKQQTLLEIEKKKQDLANYEAKNEAWKKGQATNKTAAQVIPAAQQKIADNNRDLDVLKKRLKEEEDIVSNIKKKERGASRGEGGRAERSALAKQREEYQAQIKETQAEIKELEKSNEDLKRAMEEAVQEITDNPQSTVNIAEGQVYAAKREIKELEESIKELDKEQEKLNVDLNASEVAQANLTDQLQEFIPGADEASGVFEKIGSALKTMPGLIGKVGAGLTKLAGPIGIIAAIAASAYGIWQELLAARSREASEQLEKNVELISSESEEMKTNIELANSINELVKAEELTLDNRHAISEQANKLAEAYDDERLTIYALTGQYTKLTEAIEDNQKAKTDNLQNNINEALAKGALGFDNLKNQQAGSLSNIGDKVYGNSVAGYGYDLEGDWFEGGNDKIAMDTIRKMGLRSYDGSGKGAFRAEGGSVQAILQMFSDMQAAYDELTISGLSGTDVAKNLKEQLDFYGEYVNNLKDLSQQSIDYYLTLQGDDLTDNPIDEDKYTARFNEIKAELINMGMAAEDAEIKVLHLMGAISGLEGATADRSLTNIIAGAIGATNEDLDHIMDLVSTKVPESVQTLLTEYGNLSSLFFSKNDDGEYDYTPGSYGVNAMASFTEKSSTADQVRSLVKQDEYSAEDLQSLVDKGLITQEAAQQALVNGANDVRRLIFEHYDSTIDAANGCAEAASDEAEALAKEVEGLVGETEEQIKTTASEVLSDDTWNEIWSRITLESPFSDSETLETNKEQIKQFLIDNIDFIGEDGQLLEEGQENFKQFLEQVFNIPADELNTSEQIQEQFGNLFLSTLKDAEFDAEALQQYKSLQKQLQQYKAALNDAQQAVNRMKASEKSLAEVQAYINKQQRDGFAFVDKLQSTYNTLSAAVEEYNLTQSISEDSLKKILALDYQQLSFLKLENGQVQIKTDLMTELRNATYAQMEADLAMGYQKEMDILLQGLINDEETESIKLKYQDLAASGALANGLDGVIQKMRELATSTEYANTELGQLFSNMADDAEKKKWAIGAAGKADFKTSKGGKDKKKELKDLDDEFDRYYVLRKIISDVADELSDLDKIKSHSHDRQLIDALKQENELLKDQKVAYQNLIAEQRKEQSELQATLGKMGVSFNIADGNIANYGEAVTSMLNQYNDAVNQYNAGKLSDEAFETYEKGYETFKKQLERYKSLLTEIEDTANNIDDIYYKELENNLTVWQTEIDIKINWDDLEIQWNEFLHDMNTDITLHFADNDSIIAKDSTGAGYAADKVKTIMDAANEVGREIENFANDPEYKSDKFATITEAQEKLKELNEQFQQYSTDWKSYVQEAWEAYLSEIDQYSEKMDDVIKQYDKIDESLDHQLKMNELIGSLAIDRESGTDAYSNMIELYNTKIDNDESRLTSLKGQKDAIESQYKIAVDMYGAESEAAVKLYEMLQSKQSEYWQAEEKYMEDINKKRQEQIKKAKDDYYIDIYGMSKAERDRQWADQKAINNGVYDSTQRMAQQTMFKNKAQQAIDKVPLAYQQKMKAAVEEINKDLAERNELTEYDIQAAEKKLTLLQAEAELEDSRNNKNTMTLRRNAQGNWSYQYVANEDDIAKKQENLLKASNEWYNLSKKHTEDLTEMFTKYTDEYIDRLNEIMTNEKLTDAEKTEAKKVLYEQYYGDNGYLTKIAQRLSNTEKDLQQATVTSALVNYEVDESNFDRMSAEKQRMLRETRDAGITSATELLGKDKEMTSQILANAKDVNSKEIEYFNTAAKAAADKFIDDDDSIKKSAEKAYVAMNDANETWKQNVERGCKAAGEDFTKVTKDIEVTQQTIDALGAKSKEVTDSMQAELPKVAAVVKSLIDTFDGFKATLADTVDQYREWLKLLAQPVPTPQQPNISTPAGTGTLEGNGDNGNGPGGPGATPSTEKQWYVYNQVNGAKEGPYPNKTAAENALFANHSEGGWYGEARNTRTGETKEVGPFDSKDSVTLQDSGLDGTWTLTNRYGTNPKVASGWITSEFNTGGYTGAWSGSDGRLAMLHQKELVLNADDTQNMLSAVSAIRDLGHVSSSINDAIASNIASMLFGLKANSFIGNGQSSSSESNNTFNITAEFPNANNVDDIREAILSLPTLASQYLAQKQI